MDPQKSQMKEQHEHEIVLSAALEVTKAKLAVLYSLTEDGQLMRDSWVVLDPKGSPRFEHSVAKVTTPSSCLLSNRVSI